MPYRNVQQHRKSDANPTSTKSKALYPQLKSWGFTALFGKMHAMTKREIAALACRILAIVALFSVLQSGSYWLASVSQIINVSAASLGNQIGQIRVLVWLQASPIVLQAFLAFLLWTQSGYISAKMVGEDDRNLVSVSFDERFERLTFSVLGAYALIYALPDFIKTLISVWSMNNQSAIMRRDWSQVLPGAASSVAMLLVGLGLLLGAGGISALLAKIRRAGRDAQSPYQENQSDDVSLRPEN